ncbi:zinc-binding dehydrogenase [Ktedonosporobacter rubrisoli]|nr:zinc-binding dehydrogenase [Ktedonosporobacter rubrisoli]
MRIVQAHQFGPPEVLQVVEKEDPHAEPDQVVIEVQIAGVAFGDTIVRKGLYPTPLPFEPGREVGGRITHVGRDGDQSLIGKLAVANINAGGYAERVAASRRNIFLIPPALSVEQAVSVFRAGQTALALLEAMHIQPGDTVLILAAAGSIGSLMIQLVKRAGISMVIGAARGKEKLAMVSRLRADVAIDYSENDWAEQVRTVTGGKGADVVLDAVGGTIGRQAFETLAPGRGRIGIYGFASGTWTQIETRELARRGLTVIGPLGIALTRTEQEWRAFAESALAEAAAGRLVPVIGQTYPLEQAALAHAALEARQTTGNVLLIP